MKVTRKSPTVVQAIVGTAGHVDHGKTALVKLLTGCETDRLPEEKSRGLSIDLGFAPCHLPGLRLVGIVDVPGHADFIRNMVAGAASMDVLLLVVAADDGVMPQTVEHMQIVRLLRTPEVMVALTKVDLVDNDMRRLARDDVQSFLTRVGYGDAPVIPVSNETGEGIEDVRRTLIELVERAQQRPRQPGRFRMNVERIFTVKGYGTVATGIPVSGQVNVGQPLTLLPPERPTAVRAIQTYRLEAQTAGAGTCAALNLRDLSADDLARGMTLVELGAYWPVDQLVASLENVGETLTLKRRSEMKLHTGTAVVHAHIKLLDPDQEVLGPGDRGFAHIRLEAPLVLAAGDRFILRGLSPVTTVAGGGVLAIDVGRVRRSSPSLLPRLEQARKAMQSGDYVAAQLLGGAAAVVTDEALARLLPADQDRARAMRERLGAEGVIEDLHGGWLVTQRLPELAERVRRELERYHQAHPHRRGMAPNHACALVGLEPRAFAGLSRALTRDRHLAVRHGQLALASFKPALSDQQLAAYDAARKRIEQAGLTPPARGELARELQLKQADLRLVLRLLTEEGAVRVVGNHVLSADAWQTCRDTAADVLRTQPVLTLADLRQELHIGRNLAWALLDALVADGLLRKVDKGCVLAAGASD